MNKIAKMMCLIAVVALVGTSCKKKEEAVVCTGSFAEVTEVEEGSKTYMVGSRIEWDATDKVEIFNINNANTVLQHATYGVSGAGAHATFSGPDATVDPVSKGAFYAFYPSGNEAVENGGGFKDAWTTGDGHVTGSFLLPPVQQYRTINGQTAIPQHSYAAAAKDAQTAYLGDVNFDFQPINGILAVRFYLDNPAWVTTKLVDHITFEDYAVHIAGLVQVYLDKINPTELRQWLANFDTQNPTYMAQLANYKNQIGYYIPDPSVNPCLSKTVTLQCKNEQFPLGVTLGTSQASATVFYVALRPAAFSKGMKITLYYTDGTWYVPYDAPTNNMITPFDRMNLRPRAVSYNM